jgi:hypothetical protein
MNRTPAPIREVEGIRAEAAFASMADLDEPVVMRGLVTDWPLVREARISAENADAYLRRFYQGAPVKAFIAPPGTGGRLFYTEALDDTNFEQVQTTLDTVLDRIREAAAMDEPPTVYMGSSAIKLCLPGLEHENRLPLGDVQPTVRIWLGNRTTVAAHYDVLQNIACVCAGRRRFTLFPPDQLENLYIGPMDLTPAGQQISLVDLADPDFDRFPRFATALEHARAAELEPGDAIFIPSMWWHHVLGLEPFNILINHWWLDCPAWAGPPGDALLHAILNIRDLPPAQREAWRGLFNHYVFDADEETVAHIPAASRGVLGQLDEDDGRRLRAVLRNKLNR